MKLSILCSSLTWRYAYRERLVKSLLEHTEPSGEVELLMYVDNASHSIGHKINALTAMARGDYLCQVGDDDELRDDYVPSILDAMATDPDCITFLHRYWIDGEETALIREGVGLYEGPQEDPNAHWNRPVSTKTVVRSSIAKQFTYPDLSHGEDVEFSNWIKDKLKSEVHIPRVIYEYRYSPDKWDGKQFQRKLGRCR